MKYRFVAIALLTIALVILRSQSLYAHGSEPRLEISIERANPGAVVDVRGADFEYDAVVTLVLIGLETKISLGQFIADEEGVFHHIVVLPTNLAEGTYYFRATTYDHAVVSAPLAIWGAAISLPDDSEGMREEGDALLAPMPTRLENTKQSDVAAPPNPKSSPPMESAQLPIIQGTLFITASIVILLSVGFIVLLRHSRRPSNQ